LECSGNPHQRPGAPDCQGARGLTLPWRPSRQITSARERPDQLHLDSIERLWGLMHKHITHNRCHETFADFRDSILTFLREEVPRKWDTYCDSVSDNFRVIYPEDFRVLA
jgi:hypothetical protein